jgi:hypothetical protein
MLTKDATIADLEKQISELTEGYRLRSVELVVALKSGGHMYFQDTAELLGAAREISRFIESGDYSKREAA